MNRTFRKSTELLSAISGGLLISLATLPQMAAAQQLQQPSVSPTSQVNPCPSIFYAEPHNNRVLVPQGCPPNAFTQRMAAQGQIQVPDTSVNPTPEQVRRGVGGESSTTTTVPVNPQVNVIPAPEQRSQPIATITPINGRANVTLVNNTNAVISYEVIGHTGRRLLPGREQVVLQDLPLAVTITAVRRDNGFLKFTPTTTDTGSLQLSLDEATTPDNNQGAIRIQQDGRVYLN